MTKEEILAMEAGQELDALVEEQIFNHRISQRWCWREPECGCWEEIESQGQKFVDRLLATHKGWGEDLVKQLPCYREDGELDIWDVISFYSTDISAAWQVVEKVCNWQVGDNMLVLKGQSKDPASIDPDDTGEWWEVEINGDWGIVTAEGKTAPGAICKAALLAKYSNKTVER